MRYAFIQEHCQTWPIAVQCDVLEVSRSGFYAWKNRSPSAGAQRREALTQQIRAIHQESHQDNYGVPRIHRQLRKRGHCCTKLPGLCSGSRTISLSLRREYRSRHLREQLCL